ncbi:MAG: hypothetical protein L6R36_001000 [Xanthoria steineri]|nr:MAG: hypothetical protein L6R36_001000 [Xanthoria steineri]
MPAVIATLYQLVDSDLRAKCKISFPSTEDERISHFIHVRGDDAEWLSMWTSVEFATPSPAAVLHTRQHVLELEAQCNSVWVKSHGWATDRSEIPFVRLQSSNAYEHHLRSLAPDEPFKIGDKTYLLQVDQATPLQDVQVMSSRPSTNEADADMPALNGQDSDLRSHNRLSTPNPGSGTAVLETPIARRYQDPVEPSKLSDTTIEGDTAQEKDDATLNGDDPANENDAMNIIDLESKPALVETGLDVLQREDSSTQSTESSSHELPQSNISNEAKADCGNLHEDRQTPETRIPAQRSPRKRSASPAEDSNNLDRPGLSLEISAVGQGLEGPPKKRQRPAAATDESQNSVKSTIHVELPSPRSQSDPSNRINPVQSQGSLRSTLSTPRNQRKPTELPSSNISSRSTTRQRGQGSSQDQVTKVVYASSTSVGESTAYTKFLRQHNVKQVKNVKDCDVLCTGKGELKRTSKLLLAVLTGKEVVTDQWIIQSAEQNQLLDTAEFLPEDQKREKEWGTSLADAIERGRQGLKPFDGWTINFTPSAKKELGSSWSELKEICLVAGVTAVQAMIPWKSPEEIDPTIVIAASNEADQATLEERGWKSFTKDIITFSALRGGIDEDSDEFLVAKKENGSAKRKAKKSR